MVKPQNQTKEMYVDSCRMRSLAKTPHGKAEGGLAAPAESGVHFRSDIFTLLFNFCATIKNRILIDLNLATNTIYCRIDQDNNLSQVVSIHLLLHLLLFLF